MGRIWNHNERPHMSATSRALQASGRVPVRRLYPRSLQTHMANTSTYIFPTGDCGNGDTNWQQTSLMCVLSQPKLVRIEKCIGGCSDNNDSVVPLSFKWQSADNYGPEVGELMKRGALTFSSDSTLRSILAAASLLACCAAGTCVSHTLTTLMGALMVLRVIATLHHPAKEGI